MTTHFGPYGGRGGDAFTDANDSSVLNSRLIGFKICADDGGIQYIQPVYSAPSTRGKFGHGDKNDNIRAFYLLEAESINSVTVYANDEVRGLKFSSSRGRVFSFGKTVGSSQTTTAKPGLSLQYITGRAAKRIDALTFYFTAGTPVRTVISNVRFYPKQLTASTPKGYDYVILKNLESGSEQHAKATRTWEQENSISYGRGTSVEVGVETSFEFDALVAEVAGSISVSSGFKQSWGEQKATKQTVELELSAVVPVGKSVKAEFSYQEETITIPYDGTATTYYSDGSKTVTQIHDEVKGVVAGNINVTYTTVN